jgi:hypothetical protein
MDVQIVGMSDAQWPGIPAWPITAPVFGPTKVTEVGWKWAGTLVVGFASVDATMDLPDGTGVPDGVRRMPALRMTWRGDPWLAALAVPCEPGLGRDGITFGNVANPTTSTAVPSADNAALALLRRRARFLIRSKVPGRGGSGSASAPSQESMWSPGSVTDFSPGGFSLTQASVHERCSASA